MAEFDAHFKIDNSNRLSKPQTIFKGQFYRITVLSDVLVRLEYSEEGYFEDQLTLFARNRNFPIPQMKVDQNDRILDITTKYFNLRYLKEKSFISNRFGMNNGVLKIKLLDSNKEWYFGHPEARNYGGIIANFDRTEDISLDNSINDLKSKVIQNFQKVKGLYSDDGFVSIDDSTTPFILEDGSILFNDKKRLDLYVFLYNRDFRACLQSYFYLTGMPSLLPKYALGIWWNKSDVYTYQDVVSLVQDFESHKIPLSVFLLGDNWHIKDPNHLERFNSGFTFNKELFPKPSLLAEYLHEKGIKLGLSLDPSEGIHPHEPMYEELAKLIGINEKQILPFNVFDKNLLIGYFNYLIHPLYQIGVDFFWIHYRNITDKLSQTILNHYQFQDYKIRKDQRPLLLSRPSLYAPHRDSIQYSGETIVGWNTLKNLPYFNSTSSNLGLSWWSHDIGGYKEGVEDSNLYIRYVQFGTFSPIFRFSSKYGKYYKREPWKWDIKTQNIVTEYCQLRHRLIPYLYSEAYKYHKTGLPLVQPLYYQYPELYDEIDFRNEYHFGTELLISPITKPKDAVMNRTVETLFLPEGNWYDFKTGKKFIGNKRYIVFYKDEDYPVFAKSGTILCLADLESNLNSIASPNSLEIQVFPGKSNIYTLYEDDGITNKYQEGDYLLTKIEYNYVADNYTLVICPIEGKIGIVPEVRNYRICFRNTRKADEVVVKVGEEVISSHNYVLGNDFIVEIGNVFTSKQVSISCKGNDIEIDAVRIINEDIDSIISDLQVKTTLKEEISKILFSEMSIEKKRIAIKRLQKKGLDSLFSKMFTKLLDYVSQL